MTLSLEKFNPEDILKNSEDGGEGDREVICGPKEDTAWTADWPACRRRPGSEAAGRRPPTRSEQISKTDLGNNSFKELNSFLQQFMPQGTSENN